MKLLTIVFYTDRALNWFGSTSYPPPPLTSLLTSLLRPNCAFVFFYEFPTPHEKNLLLILYLIKSILYGVWKFRNKAVFQNGRENSRAIIKYITASVKGRILIDKHRFSPNKFRSLWVYPAICHFRDNDNLLFLFYLLVNFALTCNS